MFMKFTPFVMVIIRADRQRISSTATRTISCNRSISSSGPVIVMQMADDIDRVGGDAECREPVAYRLDHLALAFFAHGFVKAGVDHDRTRGPDDCPDEEIERLQDIVRVAVDEIRWRSARMMT